MIEHFRRNYDIQNLSVKTTTIQDAEKKPVLRQSLAGPLQGLISVVEQKVQQIMVLQLRLYRHTSRNSIINLIEDINSFEFPVLHGVEPLPEEELFLYTLAAGSTQGGQRKVGLPPAITPAPWHGQMALVEYDHVNDDVLNRHDAASHALCVDVMAALVRCERLPVELLRIIIEGVTDQLRDSFVQNISEKYGIPASDFQSMTEHTQSIVILEMLNHRYSLMDSQALAKHMVSSGRCSTSLAMSALYMGRYYFLVCLLSALTGESQTKIERMLTRKEPHRQFEALVEKSGILPASFADEIFHAMKLAKMSGNDQMSAHAFVTCLYNYIIDNDHLFPDSSYFLAVLRLHPYFSNIG